MTRQLGDCFIFLYDELSENQCLFLGNGAHVIKISVWTTREYRDLGDLEGASSTVHHHTRLFQGMECQMSQLAVLRRPCSVNLENQTGNCLAGHRKWRCSGQGLGNRVTN